jgi:hypothetical protein
MLNPHLYGIIVTWVQICTFSWPVKFVSFMIRPQSRSERDEEKTLRL